MNSLQRSSTIDLVPFWDTYRRELRIGDRVVKRFRRPAKNQETILAAFQEDGWPPRIDSPLSGRSARQAMDRLHDAVKKLNRQLKPLLRFLSDGLGQGIIWQLRRPPRRTRIAPGSA
jgi:hypothetical protein